MGKIEAYYAIMHKDPPIGLGAGRLEALERHREYVRVQVSDSSTRRKKKETNAESTIVTTRNEEEAHTPNLFRARYSATGKT
jgi:hypothetical protein